jgi:ketosteroid isomerase-like protein
MSDQVGVVRRLFDAVERRDLVGVLDCYDEDVEIHEAPSLPYGGVYRGREGAQRHAMAFLETWATYQSAEKIPLDARFQQGEAGTVTAVFRHRAVDPRRGARLDELEVGVYEVRDGKVARSQMLHADPAALVAFLEEAAS